MAIQELELRGRKWVTQGHPGFFGKERDQRFSEWNQQYGEDGWRIAWELANGEVLDFEQVFWQVYVAGYVQYFLLKPEEAAFLTANYSYTYDKDFITRAQAFDPYALHNQPGIRNQFHHVSLNVALEWFLDKSFRGQEPLQVREGKLGVSKDAWPDGWKWSPGRIPAIRRDLIPEVNISGWWQESTIEHLYQAAKVLQINS